MLAQQLFNGLVVGAVYALFALGFNLVFGVHKIMNLAHGAIFMAGAFAGVYAVQFGLPLWLAFLAAIVLSGVLAVVLDFTGFRPLRHRGEAEFAAIVSSIGANMILTNLALRISGARVMRFPFGTVPAQPLIILGLRITMLQLVIMGVAGLLVILLGVCLQVTSFGRQVRAVASNERAAMLLGVDPDRVYMQTFFLSGALAGVAGVLIGLAFNAIHFAMGDPYLLRGFVVLLLGGLGSLPGSVIAGLFLGILQTLAIGYLPSGMSDLILYSVLFLVLLIRPSGLFGVKVGEARVGRR